MFAAVQHVRVGAVPQQQFHRPQTAGRGREVEECPVGILLPDQRWVGGDLAMHETHHFRISVGDHQPQQPWQNGAGAGLSQLDGAICLASPDGGDGIVCIALPGPPLVEFLAQSRGAGFVSRQVSGGTFEKISQRTARRVCDFHVCQRPLHILEPGVAVSLFDGEAPVRFPQADVPAATAISSAGPPKNCTRKAANASVAQRRGCLETRAGALGHAPLVRKTLATICGKYGCRRWLQTGKGPASTKSNLQGMAVEYCRFRGRSYSHNDLPLRG